MKKMIVYHILDNFNIPIYIGITSNQKQRFYYHELGIRTPDKQVIDKNGHIKYPHRTYLYNKLRKIIKENPEYKLENHIKIIEICTSIDELFFNEIRLIKMYKEQNIKLCNLTNGGEGTFGHKPIFNTEWKKALSRAKRIWFDNGGKNSFSGKKHTDESKKKMRKTRKENIKKGITQDYNSCIINGEITNRKGKTNIEIFGKQKASEISNKISEANKGKLLGYKKPWEEKRMLAVKESLTGKSKFTHKITKPNGEILIWTKSLYEFAISINQKGDKFYTAVKRGTKTRDGYLIERIN